MSDLAPIPNMPTVEYNERGEAEINYNLVPVFWSFDETEINKGDSKVLIFKGLIISEMESQTVPDATDEVLTVQFIEEMLDQDTGEIAYQEVNVTASMVRNFFADSKAWKNENKAIIKVSPFVNTGSKYRITYEGHKKGRKFKYANISIKPILIKTS